MPPWHPADDPASPPGAPAQPRHIGGGAGFIEEDQPRRIEGGLRLLPGDARGSNVRPLLPAGVHGFFKADALGGEEPPHRPVADMQAPIGQLAADLFQRQIRNRRDPRQQPGPLAFQARAAITAHRLGGKPAARMPNRNPINNRGDPHPKHRRRAASRQATLNRSNHPLPQIPRIWSCHACWPPSPASSLRPHVREGASGSSRCMPASRVDWLGRSEPQAWETSR